MKTVVIGAGWGDEGKGKIVDYLADKSDIIVRFSGGANAGHTIVAAGQTYALHLVPSGVLYAGKTVVLGAAMVIDPKSLFDEIDMLQNRGIKTAGRIFISDRAHIVLPGYIDLDKKTDAQRKKPIGTTGRGIGTAYSFKSSRDGIRIADLDWAEKIDELDDDDRNFINGYKEKLKSMSIDLCAFLENNKDKNILFEGAQGALLDLDLGTYPYVSSGLSCAAGAAVGGCVGPASLNNILGVFKAYSTRVGNGPFVTEFNESDAGEGELGRFVRETGHEYGVTTGRARRCGYLDLVALRYACITNSITSLVMTHIDIYDTLNEIKACTAYNINGKDTKDFPSSITALNNAKPVLKTFAGWNTDITKVASYDELPPKAKEYIAFIEDFCNTKIGIVSVGADRNQTIIRALRA
ncbi:adenylosuccinate synthetase [Spirochaetia bacterium]|nr:adenylosuccinate synthetase [Spirochaetia bacterium]